MVEAIDTDLQPKQCVIDMDNGKSIAIVAIVATLLLVTSASAVIVANNNTEKDVEMVTVTVSLNGGYYTDAPEGWTLGTGGYSVTKEFPSGISTAELYNDEIKNLPAPTAPGGGGAFAGFEIVEDAPKTITEAGTYYTATWNES